MGAIVLEANKVNSYVLPGFEKASNYVQKAYDASENLKKYLSGYNVSGIVNDLYNIKKEITNTKNLVVNKTDKAKQIESKSESKVSSIASKMASTVGAVTGAIMGAKTGLAGTAVGAVVGSAVGKKAGKTIADTGAKVAKETKSLGAKIWGGIKRVGSKVASGFKSAADWVGDKVTSAVDWIGNAASDVGNWVSDKFNAAKDWTCQALKDTGAWISNAASATWSWLKGAADTVWTHMKKIGASIANAVISLVEGVVRLVESIGDLFLLLGTCVDTIGTGIVDIVNGISTGNWDWKNTKELWDTCKTMVAYDWTSKIFEEGLYTTGFGKWLDNNAYAPFKSDALGCKICQGIGYIAGIVVISIFTFGAGGVAIGTTATIGSTTISAGTVAIVAAGAGIGKYTQEEWNKNCLAISYDGENEIGLSINYEKYKEITNLKPGQSTSLVQTFTDENGESYDIIFNISANEDGTYNIVDSDGNTVQFNGVKESSTIKGLLVGTGKGLYDGFKAYTAVSAVGNIQSFAGMVRDIGSGSYIKGASSLIKNFGVKQSLKPLATQAAKATFKDAGFYIQSGTALYGDVKSGIETGEWDPLKMAVHVGGAYANNFVGNLAGEYFESGLSKSFEKINLANDAFEKEYGKSVYAIRTDEEFRSQLVSDYTMNSDSDYAVLGKYRPTDDSFGYTSVAKADELVIDGVKTDLGAAYFEYGDRNVALEQSLGEEDVYKFLNRPYLESVAQKKQLLLSTGPYSPDWNTGFYGKELENVAQIYGYDSISELASHLVEIDVTVDGNSGKLWKVIPKQ